MILVSGINGSGKTTLLKILSGLLLNRSGYVKWDGCSIFNSLCNYCNNMIFIGHKQSVHLLLTPVENINYYMSLFKNENFLNIDEVLCIMKLYEYRYRKCMELSVGQRQRLILSRLFLQYVKLWILDEPFSYLDKYGICILNKIIFHFLENGGMVILSDHSNSLYRLRNCSILNLESYK